MNTADRRLVFAKTGGKCAYCGCTLPEKGWHLDHVKPIYRGHDGVTPTYRGRDVIENALPACPRCNRWKSTMSVDTFRHEIEAQVKRLRRDIRPFRLAEDFGLVKEVVKPIVFYFETAECILERREYKRGETS